MDACMDDMAASSGRVVVDPSGTPGFRFYPTEEELVGFYLRHRLAGAGSSARLADDVERVIPVVDVYAYHPSDLRSMAGEASARDREQWFFFCPERGGRPARTTPSGYWKATGSPSFVFSSSSSSSPAANSNTVIGVKRTMVFYQGRAPTGTKTSWKMNEYRAAASGGGDAVAQTTACVQLRNEFSVCRVYLSTGTLRSFDRRPLNPPATAHAREAPPPAVMASTSLAAVAGIVQKPLNSQGSSSSGTQEITGAVDDGNGYEEGAAIDWNSLITTADDEFSFGIDEFNASTIGAWSQI